MHYQLGVLYQNQENWHKALANYRTAAQQNSLPQDLQTYVTESKQQVQAIQNYLKQLQAN